MERSAVLHLRSKITIAEKWVEIMILSIKPPTGDFFIMNKQWSLHTNFLSHAKHPAESKPPILPYET